MSSGVRDDSDHSFQHGLSSYNASSKIMLSTIISFSIIILAVFFYNVYAGYVLRRRLAFQEFISQPPKRGLDSLAIASLPTFVVGIHDDDMMVKECAVCLSLFEEKDKARMLPDCKHVFHVSCVDMWLTTNSTCPVCRTDVEPRPRLEPEPREGPIGDRAPPLGLVEVAASSSDDIRSRLDSFGRILTSYNMNKYHSERVDHDRVVDLERQ